MQFLSAYDLDRCYLGMKYHLFKVILTTGIRASSCLATCITSPHVTQLNPQVGVLHFTIPSHTLFLYSHVLVQRIPSTFIIQTKVPNCVPFSSYHCHSPFFFYWASKAQCLKFNRQTSQCNLPTNKLLMVSHETCGLITLALIVAHEYGGGFVSVIVSWTLFYRSIRRHKRCQSPPFRLRPVFLVCIHTVIEHPRGHRGCCVNAVWTGKVRNAEIVGIIGVDDIISSFFFLVCVSVGFPDILTPQLHSLSSCSTDSINKCVRKTPLFSSSDV